MEFVSSYEPEHGAFRTCWLLFSLLLTTIGHDAVCRSSEIQADPTSRTQQTDDDALKDDTDFEKELERVRTLVLPMQKSWARDYIKDRPNSPEAKIAQELLDEYTLYDIHAEAHRIRDQQHAESIRAYWTIRQPTGRAKNAATVRITNHCDVPIIYQVKGPYMQWTAPHRLRAGHTHQFHYPALYRRLTPDGARAYALRLGGHYVFHHQPNTNFPRLFRTTD